MQINDDFITMFYGLYFTKLTHELYHFRLGSLCVVYMLMMGKWLSILKDAGCIHNEIQILRYICFTLLLIIVQRCCSLFVLSIGLH